MFLVRADWSSCRYTVTVSPVTYPELLSLVVELLLLSLQWLVLCGQRSPVRGEQPGPGDSPKSGARWGVVL